MSMPRFFLFAALFLFFSFPLLAQEEETLPFTADSSTFIEQVWNYFDNYQGIDKPSRPQIRKITADFAEIWNLPSFTQNFKATTVATMNRMDAAGMRPIPHFEHFLATITTFYRTTPDWDNFYQWNLALEASISTRNVRQFDALLQRWNLFFSEQVLFRNRGIDWKASGKYTLLAVPEIRLVYDETDLIGYANRDSTCIRSTKGVYYFEANRWDGSGGRITWERAGYQADSVYALLPDYSLELFTVNYSIDSVNFIHRELFGYSRLVGELTEKVLADATPDNAIYPKFLSYNVRIPIPEIFKNIDYEGGFTMEGGKIIGSGSTYMDAVLTVKKDGAPYMVVKSKRFSMRNDRLFAKSASAVFYYDSDSVYHPNVSLSYLDKDREITLTRGPDGTSQSPFVDSFHEMDMYFGVLSWNPDADKMEMQAVKSLNNEGTAGFVSWNYFSEDRFYGFEVLDELNPIVVVDDYTRKTGSNVFYLSEIAEYWRKPQEQAKAVLINLANYGLLNYDQENDRIEVKDRLYDFLESKNKKRDYDVLSILSEIKNTTHGELDLTTFDQEIRGVNTVFLSDSQRVVIYPANRELVLKRGRDFTFSGLIKAGLLDFYADSCSFEYDTFKLNLPQIDSLTFMIRTGETDAYGNPKLQKVQTAIQNLNGYLMIDMPFNKSGLEDYPQYPVFTNLDKAFVYYDDHKIHGGIYDRDAFYYTVDPFTFDSLNTFVPDKLEFTGKLESAGIFPDIVQPLKVQSDFSLGFETPVPDTGLPVYGGKGHFYNRLSLSNAGMHGNGRLEYLTANLHSADFLFYPDSMKTSIDTMQISPLTGPVEYPAVAMSKSQVLWLPYQDAMVIRNEKERAFDIFNGRLGFDGQLTYTPDYLMGDGKAEFGYATMKSNRFRFYSHRFVTDTTTLELSTLDDSGLALSTYVYSSSIDFSNHTGLFRTHGKGSVVKFPVNKFSCFMDEFDWDMQKNRIDLRNNIAMRMDGLDTLSYIKLMDIDFSGSEFVSMPIDKNSLRFFCLEAAYDLNENVIRASDVKLIRIGDGALFPGNGLVTIFSDAEIAPLTQAVIIADSLHKYHTIYDANVTIRGKNSISGNGFYDYYNLFDEVQPIAFTQLSVNKAGNITAQAEIPQNRPFQVSPVIDFYGDITLISKDKYLNFDGGFRLRQDCYEEETWVKVNQPINPDNVSLPSHDSLVDVKNKPVYTGLAFETIANRIYPVFFGTLRKQTDFFILKSSGVMTYDNIAEEYRIRDTVRYAGFPENGNFLNLNVRRCVMDGQGEIDLGVDFQRVTMKNFGKSTHYIIPDSTDFALLTGLNFFFNADALDAMGKAFSAAELPGVSLSRKEFLNALALMVDPVTYERLNGEIALYGTFRRFPEALDYSILFSDLHLYWNTYTRSFISHGPIGISKIGKRQINKYAEGYVEVVRHQSADVINILLRVGDGNWYFFSYSDGILQAISSSMQFNEAIINTKDKHRKLKREKELKPYQYIISTTNKMSTFVEKMSYSSP